MNFTKNVICRIKQTRWDVLKTLVFKMFIYFGLISPFSPGLALIRMLQIFFFPKSNCVLFVKERMRAPSPEKIKLWQHFCSHHACSCFPAIVWTSVWRQRQYLSSCITILESKQNITCVYGFSETLRVADISVGKVKLPETKCIKFKRSKNCHDCHVFKFLSGTDQWYLWICLGIIV